MGRGPLDGVLVADSSDETARFAGKLLADAGADVVRRRPGLPGPAVGASGGAGALDWWFDGGTRRLGETCREDEWRALVARADLLIECEPPGTVDPAELRADNPGLVHVSLTPFGHDGPWAHWKSSDLVALALGGTLSVNGLPDEPATIWGRQTQTIGGLYAATAGLAGLARARATGRGVHVELSLHQAVVSCTEHLLMYWWHPQVLAPFGAPIAPRQGSLHWVRAYEVMNCRRGACMVSPSAGGVFDLFAYLHEQGFGLDLPANPDPGTYLARIDDYMAALRELAATMDATELFEKGQSLHVPFGEVLTIAQALRNPQLVDRGFFQPVPGEGDGLRIPGPLARFSATPYAAPTSPPSATTDAAEILAEWQDRKAPAGAAPPAATSGDGSDGGEGDRRPLAGIRVVDFTHVLAGPFATRILGDLGADVVKIQTTERSQGAHANEFPYFPMWNRNKRSFTLNMTHAGALEVFRRLVEQADVVIDNFSAGVLEEWGCGHEVMEGWNPAIISISMTGCGETGPWREHVTFAPTVHALCGLTALTGPAGRIDVGPGIALNDHASGLAGAFAVLSAIEARRRSGRGQHIDLSQLEFGSFLVGPALVEYAATGREPVAAGVEDPFDPSITNIVTQAADGAWLAATVTSEEERGDALRLAAELPARSAMEELQRRGIAAGAVQDARDLTTVDPQLAHRGTFVEMESPIWGTQQTDRYPGWWSDDHGPIELSYVHSPFLGEHTFAVAAELLGMDEAAAAERMGDGLFS